MEIYLVGGVALVAGVLVGGWLINRIWVAQGKLWGYERDNLRLDLRLANERYLEALRRELANIIMGASPDEMERLYLKARQREADMLKGGQERADAEQQALTHRYPRYDDFDAIGTRHIVTYAQADKETDTLSEAYLDISHWLAIESFHSSKGARKLFDDAEMPVLDRVVRREKDTRLYRRIERAMAIYYGFRGTMGDDEESFTFQDFSVSRGYRQYTPEVDYLISFKNPEEYAVYSFFSDDGRVFHSYSRASKDFQKTTPLDCIPGERRTS